MGLFGIFYFFPGQPRPIAASTFQGMDIYYSPRLMRAGRGKARHGAPGFYTVNSATPPRMRIAAERGGAKFRRRCRGIRAGRRGMCKVQTVDDGSIQTDPLPTLRCSREGVTIPTLQPPHSRTLLARKKDSVAPLRITPIGTCSWQTPNFIPASTTSA